MTSPAPSGARRLFPTALESALVALGVGALGAGALASQAGLKLAIINESPSLPKGLYLRAMSARPEPGAIVALPPPAPAQPYLRQIGLPPSALLLKRVAAAEGELVCRGKEGLSLGGRRLLAPERDRAGRRLPAWSGCLRLGPGEVFLLGDTPASFDSRYFGPVKTAALTGVFSAALTW